jgi:P pilus assembly chaperone PapD
MSARPRPRPARPAAWFAALLLAAASLPASADMVLDRSILVFDADGAPRQDVEITNTGDETLYLDTEILAVDDPGTEDETRTPVEDPDAAGLLVTPARMVVPPGGRQLVRIVLLDAPGETDRIHRINVVPVVPPQQAEQTAVKVVVAYQLLVIVRPESPAPDLVWEREGTRITFENRGNTNVLLYNGRQCPTAEADDDCVDLSLARRLYAGNVWTAELPMDAPVEFTTTVGDVNTRRRFD